MRVNVSSRVPRLIVGIRNERLWKKQNQKSFLAWPLAITESQSRSWSDSVSHTVQWCSFVGHGAWLHGTRKTEDPSLHQSQNWSKLKRSEDSVSRGGSATSHIEMEISCVGDCRSTISWNRINERDDLAFSPSLDWRLLIFLSSSGSLSRGLHQPECGVGIFFSNFGMVWCFGLVDCEQDLVCEGRPGELPGTFLG